MLLSVYFRERKDQIKNYFHFLFRSNMKEPLERKLAVKLTMISKKNQAFCMASSRVVPLDTTHCSATSSWTSWNINGCIVNHNRERQNISLGKTLPQGIRCTLSWQLMEILQQPFCGTLSMVNMASPSPFWCEDAACTAVPSRGNEDFRFYPLRVQLKFEVVGDYTVQNYHYGKGLQ